MWLAGGGSAAGMVHGATDEFGWDAIETGFMSRSARQILHLLADHERSHIVVPVATRLTDVHGEVVKDRQNTGR